MLKKLFRHDFAAIGRHMWLFSIIVFATTALGCASILALENIDFDQTSAFFDTIQLILTLTTVMSFLAIYAYAIIGTVNIFKRYYNNLFTDEGYLTFTLPVKSSQIFGAKILSAIAWLLLIGIVEALCFCLFMITALPTYAISSLLNNFGQMITTAAEAVGVFQLVIYIIEIIVASLATVIYQIVLVYMSITFATIIAKKHRMITGVLMYFVSNMLVSILITVLAAITTVISSAFFTADSLTHEIISAEMHVQLIQFFLLYGGAATGIYFFNSFLLKKKLNLP